MRSVDARPDGCGAARGGRGAGPEGSIGSCCGRSHGRDRRGRRPGCSGRALTADTGEWGTFAWNDHVLGAPGYRIAGGSDEIQRNIIGERVLGLPTEPRVDRDIPFRDLTPGRTGADGHGRGPRASGDGQDAVGHLDEAGAERSPGVARQAGPPHPRIGWTRRVSAMKVRAARVSLACLATADRLPRGESGRAM